MAEFQEPTYEEYKKASSFARFRYKYGLFVTVACWLCLVFIIIYMVSYAQELGQNPLVYGTNKADLTCECTGNSENSIVHFYVNGSDMWLPPITNEGIAKPISDEELQQIFNNLK